MRARVEMKMAPTPIGPVKVSMLILRNSRRTEPSDESGLAKRLDIRDPLVESENDGEASDR